MNDEVPKLWEAHDLAEHKFPLPTFLVDPIIPLGGLVLLHGKRGIGKTQFCLSLANSIVNGRLFLNRFPTLPGPVLKVQVDMTPQIQQLRVQKVHKILNLSNLYYYFPRVLNIMSLSRESSAALAITELNPSIIIWDTLRKIHRENENSSESAQLVYSKVTSLFPNSTHFFVHHDKKTVVDQQALDPEEAFRGSGDWIDSTDTSMQLVELKQYNPSRVILMFHKARTAPRHEKNPIVLEMDPDTMLMVPFPTGNTLTSNPQVGSSDAFHSTLLTQPEWAREITIPIGF